MQSEAVRNLVLFFACLTIPLVVVVGNERSAATRLAESAGAASDVPIASAADEGYCSAQLKQIVRRVAGACGLLGDGGRGCKPADAKNVASMSGDDFNALFTPLAERAHIIQFDSEKTDLDPGAVAEVEKVWAEKGGASFFFVVSRASKDGAADVNTALSQGRAQAVMSHLQAKFPGDEDLKRVGLLWLGEDYAQLDDKFCSWKRSRSGECNAKEINRSSFVAWIDCAI
jgi:outer membrane protein OmpA-like peptidoglycan-associated protein